MKKNFVLIILAFVYNTSFTQSNNIGSINIRLGGNATLGAVFSEFKINDTLIGRDTSGVIATTIPFSVEFGLLKFLSANLGFRTGTWLDEQNSQNVTVTKKKVNQMMLGLKLYVLNKKNVNLFFGYDMGIGGFNKIRETTILGSRLVEEQTWKGVSHNITFGINTYFGGGFGMYFQFGSARYKYKLKELNYNGINRIPLGWTANSLIKGGQVELGFNYKFGNSDN